MARVAGLLGSLASVTGRELGRSARIAGNHFLVFTLLLFAMNPRSVVFLLGVLGLVLFFPLSMDPWRRLPQERLFLFPLSASDRARVRLLGFLLSPVVWVALLFPLWAGKRYLGVSVMVVLLGLIINGVSLLKSRGVRQSQPFSFMLHLPAFPGSLGGLVTKNIREMFHVLDPYVGLALASAATVLRCATFRPDPEAINGLTLLVVLTLSSYAQRLFALDAKEGFLRYALMPIRGWQVLWAKDLAFLLVLLVMVLPLDPRSGLAAGLVLLTFGHGPSVLDPQAQAPWCFVSGARGWSGWIQVLAMFAAGVATFRWSALILIPCLVGYLASLYFFGRRLEARWRGKGKWVFTTNENKT